MKPLVTAIACLALAAPAVAAPRDPAPEEFAFRYNAAELRTADGVDAVYSRLWREARAACVARARGYDTDYSCASHLVRKIVKQADHPDLTRRHRGRI